MTLKYQNAVKSVVENISYYMTHEQRTKDVFPKPVDSNKLLPYKFVHYTFEEWDNNLKEIAEMALRRHKLNQLYSQVRLGDLIVRINEYEQPNKAFGAHLDIDLMTYSIASFNSLQNLELKTGCHPGYQAELLDIEMAMPHKFNPSKKKYSIVVFINAHFSSKMPSGKSIGNYLEETYYSV